MSGSWLRAFALDSLPAGASRVVRHERQQIAVFHLVDGSVRAVDNRCPHEGYPLATGSVKECLLTCPWHNFKFDLRDGACVLGEEAVRVWPTRVVDGHVELDVTPPPLATVEAGIVRSLEAALVEGEIGRLARDVVRWLDEGLPAERLAALAAVHDARRREYGPSHALAVAADALRVGAARAGEEREASLRRATWALVGALSMAAEPNLRRPVREPSPAVDPGEDPHAAALRLRQLVEAEDAAQAEGLVRGAVARGWGRAELEPALFALCADHFLDFGHPLIYTIKAFDLLERIGPAALDPLLPNLVWGIAHGTREDLLPAWSAWRAQDAALAGELVELDALPRRPVDLAPLQEALLEGSARDALAAAEAALRAGAGAEAVTDAIGGAASERLLRFDPGHDASPDVQEGWLDVTHRVTFSNAVRHALSRWRSPERLRLVLQAARFVQGGRPLDLPPERRTRFTACSADPAEVVAAIEARDPGRALSAAAGVLAAGGRTPLRLALEDWVLRGPAVRPIVNAHLLKNTVVAFEDAARLDSATPVLALVRLLASPVSERFEARRVHEALALVLHGKTPRTLT